jgi:phage terminase large subunit
MPRDQVISTGYAPRQHQRSIHDRLKRFNAIVCHRRFGKTYLAINALLDAALRCEKPDPRFAYVAPTFTQAKDIAWTYLKRFALTIPGTTANESELRVDFPGGARIRLYGADEPDRMRGLYLDGCVLDEFGKMRPRVWPEVIRPALADRLGWAIVMGTPNGRNEFWKIYDEATRDPAWFAEMFKASDTGIVAPEELDAARKIMSPEQYEQEFECSFQAAVIGSYYGKLLTDAERENRITRVPYDPAVPVHTSWDLGIGDSTAIWFIQQVGVEKRAIDYYESSGVGLDHYVKVLRDKPYIYGDTILPHDAEARELGTGKSRVETLDSMGVRNVRVLPRGSVEDRINAVRMALPTFWFDAEKCGPRGLEALRQYRREYDDRLRDFRNRPLHDWSSHGADAFGHGCEGLQARVEGTFKPPKATGEFG